MDFFPLPSLPDAAVRADPRDISVEDVIVDAEAQRPQAELLDPLKRIPAPLGLTAARVLVGLGIVMLVAFWFIALRYQILEGTQYGAIALRHTVSTDPIPAPRGIITDRYGLPLVANTLSFALEAVPTELPTGGELDQTIERLSELFGLDRAELRRRVLRARRAAGRTSVVWPGLARDAALVFETRGNEFPGFHVGQDLSRSYPAGPAMSQILGYVGRVSVDDLPEHPDYELTDLVGKTGIEASYDAALRGVSGFTRRRTDATLSQNLSTATKAPQPGKNVELTVSADFQERLAASLGRAAASVGKQNAAAVAMDPRTGEILALVSLPTYDNNLFVPGQAPGEAIERVLTDPAEPLFNRALTGQYPSGSTIKPFIATGALAEHVISPTKQIFVTGSISVPHPSNPDIVYTFNDWKPHGWVDMVRAIAVSSNVYFYTVGGGFGDVRGLGIERIVAQLTRFGFGARTGIDLPDGAGLLPTPAWKERTRGEAWYIGDTYHVSIGQGDLRVTPVQLARATGAIANGGRLVVPHLARRITGADGATIEEIRPAATPIGIPPDDLAIVRRGMREAVVSGSSRALGDLPIAVSGKTGTAQVGNGKTHAWFTGYAPTDNPELVITVIVEEGGEGSSVAVPVAKELFAWYFGQSERP